MEKPDEFIYFGKCILKFLSSTDFIIAGHDSMSLNGDYPRIFIFEQMIIHDNKMDLQYSGMPLFLDLAAHALQTITTLPST